MSSLRPHSAHLINDDPLLVLPDLACTFGVDEAIFLQRVHKWLRSSKHIHEDRVWIYNTIPAWVEQMPFFPPRTMQRIIDNLKKTGVLVTSQAFNPRPTDRTTWYTIDYPLLDHLVETFLDERDSHDAKMAQSNTPKRRNDDAKMAQSIYKETKDLTYIGDDATASGTAPLTAEPPPALPPPVDEYPSPETEAEKPSPPPKKPKLSEHPAVVAYHDFHHRYPNTGQMKMITESDPPLDNWIRAVREWTGRGFNPGNIKRQLEWAHNPRLMEDERTAPAKGANSIHANKPYTTDATEAEYEELRKQAREFYPEQFPEGRKDDV